MNSKSNTKIQSFMDEVKMFYKYENFKLVAGGKDLNPTQTFEEAGVADKSELVVADN